VLGFDFFQLPFLKGVRVDPFGHSESKRCLDGKYRVVFNTYVGKRPVEFRFSLRKSKENQVIKLEQFITSQKLDPTLTTPPHWFQRLNIGG
jgi:hypothetical protein